MSDEFAEENKDFVLKITLEGNGKDGHQTRRIKLPRILDSNGKVSYEELVGLVIQLSFPAVNDASLQSKKKFYKVKLTYHDVDSDLISLGSTEELMDAVEQFLDQRFIRMNAKVERRRSPQRNQQQKRLSGEESNQNDDTTAMNPVATAVSSKLPSSPKETQARVTSNQTDQFQNVVGSIIQMLGSASVTIHGTDGSSNSIQSAKVSSKKEQEIRQISKGPKQEVISVVKSDVKDDTQASVIHDKRAAVPVDLIKTPSNNNIKKIPIAIDVNNDRKGNNGVVTDNNSEMEVKNSVENNQDEKEEKEKFIHGRHTCDMCLVTPIIGKRYHATNIPDYDLCEKCYNTHEGNEIQFEVVELERDRRLQHRWRRRNQRWTRDQNRGLQGKRRLKRDFQVPIAKRVDPDVFHQEFGTGPPQRCGDTLLPLRTRTEKSMDLEMKETIRRSLEDASIDKIVDEESNGTEKQPFFPESSKALVKIEDDAVSSYKEKGGPPHPVKVGSHHVTDKSVISVTGNEEKKTANTKSIKKNEEYDENSSEDGCREKDSSFASDAEGNGSVAGFLGETLDKFANGIDEMVMEIHRIGSDNTENTGNDKFEKDKVNILESGKGKELSINNNKKNDEISNTNNDKFASNYTAEERAECGATILESAKSQHLDKVDTEMEEAPKSNVTGDDWLVVNKNRADVQNEDTEAIALATQLIGSSLFNSGMDCHNSREEENVSALTGCSISSASSVPTNLASSIMSSDIRSEYSGIYERWEPQLKQLKELGFDEKRCVDVLEKLEAANIGVGLPDEEITVAQVVNELFK